MKKIKRREIALQIDEQVAKLEALAVDLSELEQANDGDFQADRATQVADSLKVLSIQIHGTGTGLD